MIKTGKKKLVLSWDDSIKKIMATWIKRIDRDEKKERKKEKKKKNEKTKK